MVKLVFFVIRSDGISSTDIFSWYVQKNRLGPQNVRKQITAVSG